MSVDVATTPHYGGHRLQPHHFEPARVPPEVAAFGDGGGPLGVGRPGKVGVLELDFELRGDGNRQRTELIRHYQKTPLQIMRPLYFDEHRPDIPYTYLMTTGGGVLHGDRHRYDLRFGPGTTSHVTTQAHTKLYKMEHGYATALLNLDLEAGAYVEYVPDPTIPFAQSRFYQRTHVRLDPTATLVLGETLYAGRLSRGERYDYDVFASDLDVEDPDGRPVFIDRIRLVPSSGRLGALGVLNGHDIVGSLYVVSPLLPATDLADRLHESLSKMSSIQFGVSALPAGRGVWVRLLGDDPVAMLTANNAAWKTVREALLAGPAPLIRK